MKSKKLDRRKSLGEWERKGKETSKRTLEYGIEPGENQLILKNINCITKQFENIIRRKMAREMYSCTK